MPSTLARPIIARRQLRQAVQGAIEEAENTYHYGWHIQTPGMRAVPPSKVVAILVRSQGDNKVQLSPNSGPNFTTQVFVEVEAKLLRFTQEGLQDLEDSTQYLLEECIIKNTWLNQIVEQITSINTRIDRTDEGTQPTSTILMQFTFQCFEGFDPYGPLAPSAPWPLASPPVPVPLETVKIDVDAANVYSPTGTFVNPDFPDSATPPPRTTGPDGRVEIGAEITLEPP